MEKHEWEKEERSRGSAIHTVVGWQCMWASVAQSGCACCPKAPGLWNARVAGVKDGGLPCSTSRRCALLVGQTSGCCFEKTMRFPIGSVNRGGGADSPPLVAASRARQHVRACDRPMRGLSGLGNDKRPHGQHGAPAERPSEAGEGGVQAAMVERADMTVGQSSVVPWQAGQHQRGSCQASLRRAGRACSLATGEGKPPNLVVARSTVRKYNPTLSDMFWRQSSHNSFQPIRGLLPTVLHCSHG